MPLTGHGAVRFADLRRGAEDIKIVLADDHAVVRSGNGRCSKPRTISSVVAEAGDVASTLRYVRRAPSAGARPRRAHA